jgi:hypothetical protein
MRLWSQATTSAVIQSLHDFNVFFGLQEEAEYYQPLLRRVLELSALKQQVILTGHSLGVFFFFSFNFCFHYMFVDNVSSPVKRRWGLGKNSWIYD